MAFGLVRGSTSFISTSKWVLPTGSRTTQQVFNLWWSIHFYDAFTTTFFKGRPQIITEFPLVLLEAKSCLDYLCLIYWVILGATAHTSETTEYNVVTPDFTPFNCCMPNVPNFICRWPESGSKPANRPGKIFILDTKLIFLQSLCTVCLMCFLVHTGKLGLSDSRSNCACYDGGIGAWGA